MDWNDAYANMPYIPEAEALLTRWSVEAGQYRDALTQQGKARLGVPYGGRDREAYDLFLPDGTAQGLVVFVHGGYWMKFHRDLWSHFAEGMRAQGFAVAVPSYDLCPDVSIADITAQIATAVTHAADEVVGPIHLAGHSAGGHLVARMCVAGVLQGAVAARLAMVLPISPVSDLRPLINTDMNDTFRLTEESAAAESPVLMTPFRSRLSPTMSRRLPNTCRSVRRSSAEFRWAPPFRCGWPSSGPTSSARSSWRAPPGCSRPRLTT